MISCFSIKSKIPSAQPIPLTFTVPNIPISSKNKQYILKGHLEIKVEESEIEPLLIEFTFNIILLPLEIYFMSHNGELFWDENKLSLKFNSFKEGNNFGFQYIFRNFNDDDYSFLNKNYSLKSMEKNEVDNKPLIKQDDSYKNIINIIFH